MKFKKQIPNMLSVFRLILIGVFIALFKNERYLLSFFVYIFAFGTDILDGWLARRNNWITNVGKVLDPLADKLMLIAVLACFWFKGVIPLYIMLIILAKDAIMIIVGGILYSKHVVVYADWFGKIATGLFVGAITLTFMQLEFGICPFYLYAYFAAIAAAVISFFHYGINTFIRNRKKK